MQRWLMRAAIAVSLALSTACGAQRASERPLLDDAGRLPVQAGHLRVMTFNVKSCAEGLDQVAAAIRAAKPDVVALQEVDNGTTRSGGVDQARELARRLDFPWAVHIPTTQMYGGDYGMALLSRVPIKSLERRPLPVPRGLEPRAVARAILDVGGTEIALYKAHLSPMPQRGRLRAEQATVVARMIAAETRPVILVGDFNDTATSGAVRILSSHLQDAWLAAGTGPAGTFPLPLVGSLRYDYVLASREFEIQRARVLPGDASDHHPVVADLQLPAAFLANSAPSTPSNAAPAATTP